MCSVLVAVAVKQNLGRHLSRHVKGWRKDGAQLVCLSEVDDRNDIFVLELNGFLEKYVVSVRVPCRYRCEEIVKFKEALGKVLLQSCSSVLTEVVNILLGSKPEHCRYCCERQSAFEPDPVRCRVES